MKKVAYIALFSILISGFYSCSEGSKSNEQESENAFSDFSSFPQYPFLNVDFDSNVEDNYSILSQDGFENTTDLIWVRTADSTTVVFNDEIELFEFKVYFKSRFYLKNNQSLFDYLKDRSTYFSGNSSFAEMKFDMVQNSFSLTYFTTPEYIRLAYSKL